MFNVFELGTVNSEALVWINLQEGGRKGYENDRKEYIRRHNRPHAAAGYGNAFHNGRVVLPCVEEWHSKAVASSQSFDYISGVVKEILERDILVPESERQSPKQIGNIYLSCTDLAKTHPGESPRAIYEMATSARSNSRPSRCHQPGELPMCIIDERLAARGPRRISSQVDRYRRSINTSGSLRPNFDHKERNMATTGFENHEPGLYNEVKAPQQPLNSANSSNLKRRQQSHGGQSSHHASTRSWRGLQSLDLSQYTDRENDGESRVAGTLPDTNSRDEYYPSAREWSRPKQDSHPGPVVHNDTAYAQNGYQGGIGYDRNRGSPKAHRNSRKSTTQGTFQLRVPSEMRPQSLIASKSSLERTPSSSGHCLNSTHRSNQSLYRIDNTTTNVFVQDILKHKNGGIKALDTLVGKCVHRELGRRKIVILIDDSAGMRASHGRDVLDTAEAMLWLCKPIDPSGCEIVFASRPKSPVRPTLSRWIGRTPLGKIRRQLETSDAPELCNMEKAVAAVLQRIMGPTKKHFRETTLLIFSNGVWDEDFPANGRGVENPIVKTVNEMLCRGIDRVDLAIQFVRFGNDPYGISRLEHMDDFLRTHRDPNLHGM